MNITLFQAAESFELIAAYFVVKRRLKLWKNVSQFNSIWTGLF